MIRIALYCTLVCLVAAATTKAPWRKPWFCHNLECPKYSLIGSHKVGNTTYEERMYEPSLWISSSFKDVTYEHSIGTGLFFKLFSYIQGANDRGLMINMTSPVLDEVDKKANGNVDVTRSFMVPFDLQANPPNPTDNVTIFFTRYPAMKVFVEDFPGFDIEGMRPGKIAELKTAINNTKLYDTTKIFSAGYDSPYAFGNRHNEVWLMAL